MAKLKALVDELVTANRILANQGIVDSFGHVSVRHPKDNNVYLLSRARAPELVEAKDILAYTLDGDPVDAKKAKGLAPYIERFIHGAIYEARPDVQSVVHNHSPSTIPFGVTCNPLKPVCQAARQRRRLADARARCRGRVRLDPASGVRVGLSGAERHIADAGHGHGPDQVPEQGRGRRGDRAHRSLYARSRLGRFRPPGRAEGGGVSRPVTASI
jgi:class II aldolase/adducin N-terminal domain-containing protein